MRLLAVATLVLCGAAGGCVSQGAHTAVVGERDQLTAEKAQLEARVSALEVSTAALGQELDSTLEQYEDLSVEHETVLREAERLRQTEDRLGTRLAAQSVELVRSQEALEVTRSELERLTSTYTTLMSDLESEVASGQIQIEQLREGIRVNVSDDILFDTGSTRLDPVGRQVLDKVAAQLAALDHDIEVQGHTDDRQIRGSLKSRFPSNWELAAARAGRVVRLLEESGITGDRLTLVSYASFRPIAPNETADERALNRRIEIRLKPKGQSDAATASADGGAVQEAAVTP